MLELTVRLPPEPSDCSATMTLPFDQRQKSRFRGQLDRGEEVAVLLPRGTLLRGGDVLTTELGHPKVRVVAAPELLSVVRSEDPGALLRAAYHLGNRHIALQIEPGELRFAADHVLDEMLHGLGIHVGREHLPFEPEAGAYGGGHGHHHPHHE